MADVLQRERDGEAAAGRLYAVALSLQKAARSAESLPKLKYSLVNELHRLVRFRQAALLEEAGRGRGARVTALSGVPVADRSTGNVQWIERVVGYLAARGTEEAGEAPREIVRSSVTRVMAKDWESWGGAVLLCPLVFRGKHRLGWLWIARDEPWSDAEKILLQETLEAYAHAWVALRRGRLTPHRRLRGLGLLLLAGALTAALFIPVRLSALAPAVVSASAPLVVRAPLDGVVESLTVVPNQQVAAGDLLFSYDATNLTNEVIIAQRQLEVAQTELLQATQGAFDNAAASGQVAVLRAQVELRQAELAYARARLERVEVRAEQPGVVLFDDADQWTGRTVSTGEKVLEVADPQSAIVEIFLPVREALRLETGSEVRVFLDSAPLDPLTTTLEAVSYRAEPRPDGALAYRLRAEIGAEEPLPGIGLQGTAKLQGEEVPLYLLLLRRPIATLRQSLGF